MKEKIIDVMEIYDALTLDRYSSEWRRIRKKKGFTTLELLWFPFALFFVTSITLVAILINFISKISRKRWLKE